MYPHPYSSISPSASPRDIFPSYDKYYSKESALPAPRFNSWSTYSYPSRSPSHPHSVTAVNPKVTILPSQPPLVSDIDTPSSTSSHSVLTPLSPFSHHNVGESDAPDDMEFDEFEYDDDEDEYIDSDFAEDMDVVDEAEGQSQLYGALVSHAIKSTSALEGALGDVPSSSYDGRSGAHHPADRRMSASVPGYPSASHRSSTVHAHQPQRWSEKETSAPSNSFPETTNAYPPQHMYTQRGYSSTTLFAPTPSTSLYHQSSSALAGAFISSARSSHSSRPTSNPLPIMQPQPIRPIPPIPLAELTSSAIEGSASDPCGESQSSQRLQALSPLPLLCQPVSDAVRYQLKEPSANGPLDDICYDEENTSDSMCEDFITVTENNRFAHEGLAFSREHPSAAGTTSMEGQMCSCGCMGLAIGWR
ncbi:hypothetical protein HYDPIDRAFT_26709 [Hydnomerulius pinastri MD-312]|nr:hypothetical protein HYDPIDRAFT_26709 [Hydnomerulius pinastri MD-312]